MFLERVKDRVRSAVRRIASEPAAIVAVAVAAANTATDQSWKGYGAAVGVALLRFLVKPAKDFRPDAPPVRDF